MFHIDIFASHINCSLRMKAVSPIFVVAVVIVGIGAGNAQQDCVDALGGLDVCSTEVVST